ncbi:MAG: Ig-like domain-containing protein [Lachnospiraceae bacterium]|nr:Ig-like domain-containing protein [Lachnospiraceae bacterium]
MPQKKGKATITAKINSKTYKCKVTVKNPYLNNTRLTLIVGTTHTLKITGSKAKSWKSSNTSIATVSKKGVITAKKAGNVTITCKAKNKKSYKCNLTVQAKSTDEQTPSQPNEPTQPSTPDEPTTPNEPVTPDSPTTPDSSELKLVIIELLEKEETNN